VGVSCFFVNTLNLNSFWGDKLFTTFPAFLASECSRVFG